MSGLPAALLDPLRRFRPTEDGHFIKCEPDGVPEELRSLLVHTGDMTSKLEKYHSSKITLEILQSGRGDAGHYYREVLLRSANKGDAVEYGAIEIFLDALPDPVQRKIIEGKIPLGGLLNTYGVHYHSHPQAFFRVLEEPCLCELLCAPLTAELYGRCNILCTEGGVVLARILEVLPPVSKPKTSIV